MSILFELLETLIRLLLTIHNPLDLDKSALNQVIENFALHFDIPHDPSRLEIFEQNNTLQPYFVLIVTLLAMIHAFITPNQVVKHETKIVTQVLILLVDDNLMIARELYLVVLNQLRQVSD